MTEEWVNKHNHEVLQARAIADEKERNLRLEALDQERIYETLRCQAHMAERVKKNERVMERVQIDLAEIKECQSECKARQREKEAEKEGMKKGATAVLSFLKWASAIGGAGGLGYATKFITQ